MLGERRPPGDLGEALRILEAIAPACGDEVVARDFSIDVECPAAEMDHGIEE